MVIRRVPSALGLGRRAAASLRLRRFSAAIIVAGALAPATRADALWDDRLELFVAESVTRDDNVFRLSSAQDLAAAGLTSRGDTYRTTSLGFRLDVPVSRQRFTGDLVWNDTRYDRFSFVDFTGHAGRAAWLWQVGNELSGRLGYAETLALSSFSNVQSGGQGVIRVPNAITIQRALFNVGYQLTPRWEVRGEASKLKQSNELAVFQVNDVTVDGADLTVSYVTPSKNKLGLSARVDEARYPNPQIVGGTLIDNAYRQQSIAAVADWTLTGHSHVIARAGRVRRDYEQLPERDFEGPTLNVAYDWTPTGMLSLTMLAQREISASEETTTGFVLVTGAALRPTLRLTEKVRMSGIFEYSEREYRGDPTQASTTPPRIDHVRGAGVTVSYRPARPITLEAAARRESRSSTVAFGDYVANVVSATVRIGF